MKMSILSLSIVAAIGFASATALAAPESDSEVAARKAALDLAGAFSNEGFKMRDGHWSGTIKPKEHALIAVNLYAGNQYWFSVGATEPAKKISLNLTTKPASSFRLRVITKAKKRLPDFRQPAAVNIMSWLIWSKAARAAFASSILTNNSAPPRPALDFSRARYFV